MRTLKTTGEPADIRSPYFDLPMDSPLIKIAFMEFLESWADETGEFSEWLKEKDGKVESLWRKWIDEWLPMLKQSHCGDCTCVPMACTRCWTEYMLDNAKYIFELK